MAVGSDHGAVAIPCGVDLRAAYGTDVTAVAVGEAVFAGERGGYGNLVILRYGRGLETRYGRLAFDVRAGEAGTAGASIGRVGSSAGSTAPHLHFEVHVDGERVDQPRWRVESGEDH